MWLIVLEALAALAILVLAVWWTMFSGRRGGERTPADEPPRDDGEPGEEIRFERNAEGKVVRMWRHSSFMDKVGGK